MRKIMKPRLIVPIAAAMAVLLAAGVALAAGFTSPTRVELDAPAGARQGKGVEFTIRLHSANRRCRYFKHVTLFVDGKSVEGGETHMPSQSAQDNAGVVTLKHAFANVGDHQVWAHFGGSRHGRHPNRRVCLADESNPQTIHIRARHRR